MNKNPHYFLIFFKDERNNIFALLDFSFKSKSVIVKSFSIILILLVL